MKTKLIRMAKGSQIVETGRLLKEFIVMVAGEFYQKV